MAKVLLIYPGIGISGFNPRSNKHNGGEFDWIHHGIAMIGAVLLKAGHQVILSDLRKHRSWTDLAELVRSYQPDWVGISASYLDTKAAKVSAKIAKRNAPSCKVVVGGLSPTLDTHLWTDDPDIDHVITNEGEVSILKLLNGEITDRVIKGEQPDLSTLPFAARDLFDYPYELASSFSGTQPTPMVTMISARGCCFKCNYCQPAERMVFGDTVRQRPVEHVISELKELRSKYNFKSITWWDDTFTINKEWLTEFCRQYKAEGFTANMVVCNRADIICRDEETVAMLADVGVTSFVIGFETGTNRMLNFLKKGTTVEMNIKAAEICRKYGIEVFGTFMLGLPTETKEEALATYNMVKAIKPDYKIVFYFTPIPGTEIYQYCTDNNLMLRDDALSIERTGNYKPKIRGIDYQYLDTLREDLEMQLC
jgi:anaerobic magnesium-protoporphyrin IX monomethyl ester cyclase